MRITRLFLFVVAALSFSWMVGHTQTQLVTTPDASPKAKVMQEIGLTQVTVAFHRPAVKGRDVWDQLAPQGAVWRAGANDNTVIHFSEEVRIEGRSLPAGKYGLHIIPRGEKATIIFSHNASSWGSFSYTPEEDALRVEVNTKLMDKAVERLNFEFWSLSPNSATCALVWEKLAFPFLIETATEEVTVRSLREELRNKAGWTWKGWHEASSWCLQNDTNLEEALTWASRSVFMQPNPQNLVVKARLYGKVNGEGEQNKETELAMESLERDLNQYPLGWREYNAAANFALNNDHAEQALAWSKRSIEDRENMPAMILHSKVMAGLGKTTEAEKYHAQALEIGTNAELNAYGYQLLFSGKGEEALAVFQKNTERHPEDPNVWDSLGEGYYTLGMEKEAIEALNRSLSMDPPPNVKANSLKLLGQMGVKMEHKPGKTQ